ncbi:MAG: histidine kinase dimerization/phospho-acceptor domain-containing protein, partial [Thiomonas sp.]
ARELGPRYALRWSLQGEQRLWVRPTPEGLSDWIGFPTRGLLPGLLHLLLLSSAASFVLALLGAWWMHRTIRRPMQALARAAEAVGRGRAPPEIAAVLDSFERMAASLEQAAQERAVMLAGVSHDLRTPLAKLRLCVEMLRPEADAGLIATMERSILAANGIIGQFVDFARVGADEPQQTVDLAELVRSAIADVAADGPVAADLQPGCIATVRPLALRRLVTNLLDNARRHAGGEIDVELRCPAD